MADVAEAIKRNNIQSPKPNAPQLIDNHGRVVSYVRLSVTDRCNLRCIYCMPEQMKFMPQEELLSFDELFRLMKILSSMGISKVRITGGEPFMRDGLTDFLWRLKTLENIEEINITTNGVLTKKHIPELKRIGIASVNLSLDTLDRERFKHVTRRDELVAVMDTFYALLRHNIAVKINAVVTDGFNTDDIVPLADLTKSYPVSVRFIEEMPFNGVGADRQVLTWDYKKILSALFAAYPTMKKLDDEPFSTSMNYTIDGHYGSVGVIAAYSRTFCGTCNRIRLTPKGKLHTCLYSNEGLDLKHLLRQGATDDEIERDIRQTVSSRYKDGFDAEANRFGHLPVSESMSTIGG
jgi:cyclic pyranopterin phosphate synthase